MAFDPLENKLWEALESAQKWADQSGVAHTVFQDAESFGWIHRDAFSPRVAQAIAVHATMLPATYFD